MGWKAAAGGEMGEGEWHAPPCLTTLHLKGDPILPYYPSAPTRDTYSICSEPGSIYDGAIQIHSSNGRIEYDGVHDRPFHLQTPHLRPGGAVYSEPPHLRPSAAMPPSPPLAPRQ